MAWRFETFGPARHSGTRPSPLVLRLAVLAAALVMLAVLAVLVLPAAIVLGAVLAIGYGWAALRRKIARILPDPAGRRNVRVIAPRDPAP